MNRWTLPADRTSPALARGVVHDVLSASHRTSVCDDAVLLVSEIVTNAVIHARTPLRLVLHDRPDVVRVEVEDGSREQPVIDPAGDPNTSLFEGGRGLQLLARVADDWGVDSRGRGKAVWFELVDPEGSSPGRGRAVSYAAG